MKKRQTGLGHLPVISWCDAIDSKTMEQVRNLARHPKVFHHVALMPDCHLGYGMPIGGVIACEDAVIPNAVGVDIGCGVAALQTDCPASRLETPLIHSLLDAVKRNVPMGEGRAHRMPQTWEGFERYGSPAWIDSRSWDRALCSLGTLGGGNHFIELQEGDDGLVWLMLHSGSRNLGLKIAEHHHRVAQRLNLETSHPDLAWLPVDSPEGAAYLQEMSLALDYAAENRRRMMQSAWDCFARLVPGSRLLREVNIHHNYVAQEEHFGRSVWVHRKGATSARSGQTGLIPGSMGTASYVVEGLGEADSFESCSHGAGRCMGRRQACRELSRKECDRAMEGVVFDGWKPARGRGLKGLPDLEEAPPAYKDIERVIDAQRDLVMPVVRLRPRGVLKG